MNEFFDTKPTEIHGEAQAGRAAEVRKNIESLKENMSTEIFALADLLSEAKDKGYHFQWGFQNFGDYVNSLEIESMKARQAEYLIKIVTNAKKLGIERKEYRNIAVSKLKEIFSLDTALFATDIKLLLLSAGDYDLEHIKSEVRELKGFEGENELTWRNFQVTKSQAEVIDQAIERVKMEFGDSMDEDGNPQDISDGRALELLSAEKLAEPLPE